ncbi:MAG: PspA-associated protein PspAA [Actinomycetota bacterium]
MILRILGEGQFEVSDEEISALNELDERLVAQIEAGDEASFQYALAAMAAWVREHGAPVPEDYLGPSDLVLPRTGATIAEVRELLGDEGLIPG